MNLIEYCPSCHQPSTVLFSLGHCGHCSFTKPAEEVTSVNDPDDTQHDTPQDAGAGQDDQAGDDTAAGDAEHTANPF